MQYVIARLEHMPLWFKCLWVPFYAVKCVAYLAVDRCSRSAFNRLFVNDFRGMSATREAKSAMAALIQEKYLAERVFPAAAAAVAALKRDDFRVVLVTGSLDFLVAPLAHSLGVDHVIANALEEEPNTGTFTVWVWRGPPPSLVHTMFTFSSGGFCQNEDGLRREIALLSCGSDRTTFAQTRHGSQ